MDSILLFYIRQDKQDYQNKIHLRWKEELQDWQYSFSRFS